MNWYGWSVTGNTGKVEELSPCSIYAKLHMATALPDSSIQPVSDSQVQNDAVQSCKCGYTVRWQFWLLWCYCIVSDKLLYTWSCGTNAQSWYYLPSGFCQSIMAVRYKKPRLIEIYVMSIDQAWFGIICHSANWFFTIFKIDGNIILLILDVNCNIKKADCERMCSQSLKRVLSYKKLKGSIPKFV